MENRKRYRLYIRKETYDKFQTLLDQAFTSPVMNEWSSIEGLDFPTTDSLVFAALDLLKKEFDAIERKSEIEMIDHNESEATDE